MTKVLQVVPYFAPAWSYGGPPKVMWEEAKALADLGHAVTVFTTDTLGKERSTTPSPSLEDGVLVHRFRNVSNWLAFHKYRFTPRGFVGALRSVDAGVLHLSEVRHELAIGAWSAARRRDLPIIVSAHGTLPRRSGPKAAIRIAYDRRFVTPMIRSAAALLAQTRHEAALYLEAGADPAAVHLLPLGTSDPPAPDNPDILDVPGDAKVILFLGRIHPLKGCARLIDGFAAVAPRHPDWFLVLAGRDDGDLERCRQRAISLGIEDRVRFPGAIYGDARYDAYRRADLFAITPTHFEETSLASLEAASVATPLLLSEEAEAPYLEEFGAGRCTPAGANIADDLDELLGADLALAGQRASKMIEERHRWQVVGITLDDIVTGAAR